jgi:NADH-quinone oxidoreductase subunit A
MWPLVVYAGLVVVVVGGMLGVSALLGQRHSERATGEPYESGIASAGSARVRFGSRFWVVAILFVIFDLEAMFVVAWATAATDVGWPGYVGLLGFLLALVVALIYEWRMGALDILHGSASEGEDRGPTAS